METIDWWDTYHAPAETEFVSSSIRCCLASQNSNRTRTANLGRRLPPKVPCAASETGSIIESEKKEIVLETIDWWDTPHSPAETKLVSSSIRCCVASLTWPESSGSNRTRLAPTAADRRNHRSTPAAIWISGWSWSGRFQWAHLHQWFSDSVARAREPLNLLSALTWCPCGRPTLLDRDHAGHARRLRLHRRWDTIEFVCPVSSGDRRWTGQNCTTG